MTKHTMTNDRIRHLERTGEPITRDEMAEGWHFCEEYDGGVLAGEEDETGCCAWCGFDRRRFQ